MCRIHWRNPAQKLCAIERTIEDAKNFPKQQHVRTLSLSGGHFFEKSSEFRM